MINILSGKSVLIIAADSDKESTESDEEFQICESCNSEEVIYNFNKLIFLHRYPYLSVYVYTSAKSEYSYLPLQKFSFLWSTLIFSCSVIQ